MNFHLVIVCMNFSSDGFPSGSISCFGGTICESTV
jgi:hypothetical protein